MARRDGHAAWRHREGEILADAGERNCLRTVRCVIRNVQRRRLASRRLGNGCHLNLTRRIHGKRGRAVVGLRESCSISPANSNSGQGQRRSPSVRQRYRLRRATGSRRLRSKIQAARRKNDRGTGINEDPYRSGMPDS